MKTLRAVLSLALLTSALSACEPAAPPQPEPSPDPQPTVFDDQIKTIERAKAVEGQVLDQQKAQDAEIERQGG